MRFRPRNRAARYMTWARYLVKIPWMFPSSPANSEYQTHQRPMQLQSTPMTIADDAHYMFTLSLQYTLFFEGIINSEHLEPITSGPSHEVHHNGSVLEERCERFLGNEHFSKVLGKRAPRSSGYICMYYVHMAFDLNSFTCKPPFFAEKTNCANLS